MSQPFSLRIFVADGDPDGLRIVDKSNWIGKALVFPRALLPQVKARPELAQTGVYLLLGPRPDGEGDMLYVGEGDPIRPRLESHYAQKDFWTRAIGFTTTTAGQLNKAHVQFLESRLIALAKAAKRLPLDNANQPAEPSLSEADRADMEVFLGHMLGMLPVLGVHAFERAPSSVAAVHATSGVAAADASGVLYCKGKDVVASGYESTQGFVVRSGSFAVVEVVPSLRENWPARIAQRRDLRRCSTAFYTGLRVYFAHFGGSDDIGQTHQRAHQMEGRTGPDVEGDSRGRGAAVTGLASVFIAA